MKVFAVLLFAVPLLVLGLASCGDFEFYGEADFDGTVDANSFAGGPPAELGGGPRTPAELVWIGHMNRECKRRDKRIAAVPPPAGGPLEMQRYADAVLDVLREYQHRAAANDAPASYALEAEWVAKVDAAKEEAMQDVFFAAGDADLEAARAAVAATERIIADTRTGLLKAGLRDCVRFS